MEVIHTIKLIIVHIDIFLYLCVGLKVLSAKYTKQLKLIIHLNC